MASSKFVTTTLNGMFITHLAAWMTTPVASAATAADQLPPPSPALLSRASDDSATELDDEWTVHIPVKANTEEQPLPSSEG